MRDQKRIARILKLIEDKWNEMPDQRFGQLLVNLGVVPDTNGIWHVEDDELEEHLNKIK